MNPLARLEKVKPEEWPRLQELCSSAFSQNFAHHFVEDGLMQYLEKEFGEARLQKDLHDPQTAYFYIHGETQHLGFVKICYHFELDGEVMPQSAELEKIYLLPSTKGQGLGKKSLQKLYEICRNQAIEELYLYVIDHNQAAIEFYQKQGFEIVGTGRLEATHFKEHLRGMHLMRKNL